jgi:chromosome segregation ATPase
VADIDIVALILAIGSLITALSVGLRYRGEYKLNAKKAALDELTAVVDDLQERNNVLRQRLKEQDEDIAKLSDKIEAKETRIAALENQIEIIKQERNNRELELNERIKCLESDLENEKKINGKLRSDLDKANAKIASMQAEIAKLKKTTGELQAGD